MTVGIAWLPQTAFLFILIFARVGTILMLIPALGEQTIPAQLRRAAGIDDSLLRLSVGIEDGDDLLRDLDAALLRAVAVDKSKRRVIA